MTYTVSSVEPRLNVLFIDYVRVTNCFYDYDYYYHEWDVKL